MLLGSLPELSCAWLAFISLPPPATQDNSAEEQRWNTRNDNDNAKLYWNLELNRKVPLHPDVPTEFFSHVSQWIHYKKEVSVVQCSHHYNLVRLRTTAYGESSLEFNIPSSAARLTIVPCSPSLICNQHDLNYIFLPRHWFLSSITIPISSTPLQLGMLRAYRRS